MKRYQTRSIRFHGQNSSFGFRLKRYSIVVSGREVQLETFEPGMQLVESALPSPALTSERPAVGFCIAHHGIGADYAVLGYWDRENELPLRIAVNDHLSPGWRWAERGESICVWDLEVIWFERQAYVSTMLAEGTADEYLQLQFK